MILECRGRSNQGLSDNPTLTPRGCTQHSAHTVGQSSKSINLILLRRVLPRFYVAVTECSVQAGASQASTMHNRRVDNVQFLAFQQLF